MVSSAQPARKSASVCLAYIVFLTLTYHLGIVCAGIFCAAFALLLCAFASKRIGSALTAALLLASALGYFSMTAYVNTQRSLRDEFDGTTAYVTAFAENVKSSDEITRIKLRVETIDGEKAPLFLRVLLSASDCSQVTEGDKVSGYLKFKRISDSGDFPSVLYYDGEAVSLFADADSLKTESSFSFLGLSAAIREFINQRFEKFLPDMHSLARAIMLGDKSDIDDSVYKTLSADGITHILCVSGLHIGILIAAVSFVISKLKISKSAKKTVICSFALFYMFLTGFSVSVCRAGIMACVVACDNLTRRRPDSLTSLSLTAALFCLFSPQTVLCLSFRLSFLATAGIIIASDNLAKPISKRLGSGLAAKFCAYVLGVICLSLCAVSVCVPVISVYFGTQSALAPLGNLVCAPIAEVFLILCFVLVPVSFVPFLGAMLGAAAELCGKLFLNISNLLAQSAVYLDISSPPLAAVSSALVFVLLMCCIFDTEEKPKITLAFVASSLVLMLASSLL